MLTRDGTPQCGRATVFSWEMTEVRMMSGFTEHPGSCWYGTVGFQVVYTCRNYCTSSMHFLCTEAALPPPSSPRIRDVAKSWSTRPCAADISAEDALAATAPEAALPSFITPPSPVALLVFPVASVFWKFVPKKRGVTETREAQRGWLTGKKLRL